MNAQGKYRIRPGAIAGSDGIAAMLRGEVSWSAIYESPVLRQFELPDPMGLETVRPQDALHPTDADAGRLCNGTPVPCESRWMRPPQHLPAE